MTRNVVAKVVLATTLAIGGACSPADSASNGGTGGRASGGTTATGGTSGGATGGQGTGGQATDGTGGGSGGTTGGEATGGQTPDGTGGTAGMSEQSGGHSGAGGPATGGRPSGGASGQGGLGGSVTTGTGGGGGTVAYAPCPTNGSACKILPLGDSITMGDRSSDKAGYRSRLYTLIVAAKQKVTFIGSLADGPTQVSGQPFPRMHEGHSGWTINQLGSLIPSPALTGGPHIILLDIGANDVFPNERDTMATRLDALVEKVAQNAPTALIVLAQITPVGVANNGHTAAQVDLANAAQAAYNSKIPGIIQAHAVRGQHIIGADMSKMPLSGLGTATLHPNDSGYTYMAGIWYAVIKDLLPK